MTIYDKARWQIDGGKDADVVTAHFQFIFGWLNQNNLLSEYGKAALKTGIDATAVLTDEMVNVGGNSFLEKHYDEYISKIDYGINENEDLLREMYFKL